MSVFVSFNCSLITDLSTFVNFDNAIDIKNQLLQNGDSYTPSVSGVCYYTIDNYSGVAGDNYYVINMNTDAVIFSVVYARGLPSQGGVGGSFIAPKGHRLTVVSTNAYRVNTILFVPLGG